MCLPWSLLPQVDAWAAGCLAAELITGAPPFESESRSATYQLIMYREVRLPSRLSQAARSFISTALVKVGSCPTTVVVLCARVLRHSVRLHQVAVGLNLLIQLCSWQWNPGCRLHKAFVSCSCILCRIPGSVRQSTSCCSMSGSAAACRSTSSQHPLQQQQH
jgi:serine/threonine protein kinase